MKRIYQRIVDPERGDCMKCCIASILDLEYDDVPNFVEYDDWYSRMMDFMKKFGYNFSLDTIYNPNVTYLETPTHECFKAYERDPECFFPYLKPEYGINGLYLATVYSPKYTTANENPITHLHSVICDKDFRIIHDPNPEYAALIQYPYAKLIGYNGIRCVDKIEKIFN